MSSLLNDALASLRGLTLREEAGFDHHKPHPTLITGGPQIHNLILRSKQSLAVVLVLLLLL